VQDNEKFVIKADIPGVDKNDIKVSSHIRRKNRSCGFCFLCRASRSGDARAAFVSSF
jgi:hypothetical protein